MNANRLSKLLLTATTLVFSGAVLANGLNSDFGGRRDYSHVNVIGLADLHRSRAVINIVDVRPTFEYRTLHIKDARHVDLRGPDFLDSVKTLIDATGNPVAFYCGENGCKEAFAAADEALRNGIEEVMVYDAGVVVWANSFPNETELLGESLQDPSRLIDETRLQEKLISPEEFSSMVQTGSFIVIDARTKEERSATGLFVGREQHVPLDDQSQLETTLEEAARSHTPLLVYDEDGRTVRWLQYQLEKVGIANYRFMDGGVAGFLGASKPLSQSTLKSPVVSTANPG